MSEPWEYKFLVGHGVRSHLRDGDGVEYGPLCEELLNRLGREGWEVCSHNDSAGSQPSLIVKRCVGAGRGRDRAEPA